MTQEQFMGLLRHGLTFVGGIVLMKGVMDESAIQELIGAAITFAGSLWSVFSKKK